MEDKIRNAFVSAFAIEPSIFSIELTPDEVRGWDSLGHLRLIAALQEQFEIEFEVDEVMQMENVRKIIEIISRKTIQNP